jgi:hypothetical protein
MSNPNSFTRRRWLRLAAAAPALPLALPGAGRAAPEPGEGVSDVEYNGPFPDELDVVRDYGADPTGAKDSTAAFQNAINALAGGGVQIGSLDSDPPYRVYNGIRLHVPAGTYSIRETLRVPDSGVSPEASFEDCSIVGADPRTVTLRWDGPPNGDMMWLNGCNGSMFARLGFDGQNRARACMRLERDTRLRLSSQSFNRIEECIFRNARYGFFNTQGTDGATANQVTDSEVEIVRCRFYKLTNRGVCNTGVQAFDYWIRQSYFEDCLVAISNGDSGSADRYPFDTSNILINTMGTFSVFDCVFNASTLCDIQIWGGQNPRVIARNFSINSQRFLQSREVYIEVLGNTVIDPLSTDCLQFFTALRGNTDPKLDKAPVGRIRTVVLGNRIRSRSGASGPVISEVFDPALDAQCLAIPEYNVNSLVAYVAEKPLFFAWNNAFSVTTAKAIGTDPTFDNTVILGTKLKQTIDGTMPPRPPISPKVTRRVFTIAFNGEAPQATVDAAVAYARANAGSQPVVYHPNFLQQRFARLSAPVTFPANLKMSLQGSGRGSVFSWDGDKHDAATPVLLLRGPSKLTIRDHHGAERGSANAGGKDGRILLIDACDQAGARLYGENGAGWLSTVGTAHLEVDIVDHDFDSNTDDNLPCRTTGHATVAGRGRTLLEGCTVNNDRPTAVLSVQAGGRLFTRYIWFESGIVDQVNLEALGNTAPRPGVLSVEASRWYNGNCNRPFTRGGTNWRFVQQAATDFAGLLLQIGSAVMGETRLSGDTKQTDFVDIGGTTVIEAGNPAPRTMYRDHGPGSALESRQDKDSTPFGVTGTLPNNIDAVLQQLLDAKPVVLIDAKPAGITDVRFYRVTTDVECIATTYA